MNLHIGRLPHSNLQSTICNRYCTREFHMRKIIFLIGCFALPLAACGQAEPAAAPTSAASEPPTSAPTAAPPTDVPTSEPPTSAPTAAPPTDVPPPIATPSEAPKPGQGGGTSIAPPPDLVDAAQRQLALYLKVSPAGLPFQSANSKEWPDGALGCPQD